MTTIETSLRFIDLAVNNVNDYMFIEPFTISSHRYYASNNVWYKPLVIKISPTHFQQLRSNYLYPSNRINNHLS